ncbi:MAG: hypothetical protein KKD39_02110 [Candidatus Altiarchaeota archaeon]|nr:hypothetical protein [Candidatus Altiarchaeota archaeon]
MFENLLDWDGKLDIRDVAYSKGVLSSPYLRKDHIHLASIPGYGFLVLKTKLLPLFVVFSLMLLIWHVEVFTQLKKTRFAKIVFCIVVLFFLVYSFELTDMLYGGGWYPKEKDELGYFRYMKDNATLKLYNGNETTSKVNLQITLWSYERDNVVNLYLNRESIGSYVVSPNGTIASTAFVYLKPGVNLLTLSSQEDCNKPENVLTQGDSPICYSFALRDIKIIPSDDPSFDKGWYPREEDELGNFRYMGNNASFSLHSNDVSVSKVNLRLTLWSHLKDRMLDLYLNGEKTGSYMVSPNGAILSTEIVDLNPGENILTLSPRDACSNHEGTPVTDTPPTCYSFAVRNIEIIPVDDPSFDKGWYPREEDEFGYFTYMGSNASLKFMVDSTSSKQTTLTYLAWGYNGRDELEIYLNNKSLGMFKVLNNNTETLKLQVSPGVNTILFHSTTNCDIPQNVENNSLDTRCLSFAFREINLMN